MDYSGEAIFSHHSVVSLLLEGGRGYYLHLVNRAHCFQKYTKAPQAAGRIHSDFEKGFIMAEVMKVADLMEHGGEAEVII